MKDEIKEILEHIQYVIDEDDYWEVTKATLKPLLDYITNLEQVNKNQAKRNSRQRLANQKQQELILKLQQENKRLKEENKYLNNELNNMIDYAKDLEDYKYRCEKAIEYIEDNTYYKSHKGYVDLNDLLNILQNGSEKDDR